MRKTFLVLCLMFTFIFVLSACSNESNTTSNNESEKQQNEKQSQKDNKTKESKESNVEETEGGTKTTFYLKKDLDFNSKSGPINLTVNAVQAFNLKLKDQEMKSYFDDKDSVDFIVIKTKVENTSDEDITIFPDQGTITTDTGEQVDAELLLSDDLGGEYYGKVNKEGDISFQVKDASKIKKITFIVNAAVNAKFESVGEKIKLDIPLN